MPFGVLQSDPTSTDQPLPLPQSLAQAALGIPRNINQALQGELLRLGGVASQFPSLQDVRQPLGEIVRQPFRILGLPTGITAGLLPGTRAGEVARGLERETQDVSLAGLGDIGILQGILGAAGAAGRGVSGAVRSRVLPAVERQRFLRTPTPKLIQEALSSGERGAEIIRTLRQSKSPKLKQVRSALEIQRAGPSRLLTSERGAAFIPRQGDFVRLGKRTHRVLQVNPEQQVAVLAVTGGKTLTAPFSQLKPLSQRQAQQAGLTEAREIGKTVERGRAAAVTEPKIEGLKQEVGQRVTQEQLLRRSLTGQGKAFAAGEQTAKRILVTPRQSLARQGRAFAAGERAGRVSVDPKIQSLKDSKNQLVQQFRARQVNIEAVRQLSRNIVTEHLLPKDRSRFLTSVSKAKTLRQAANISRRVHELAERQTVKTLTTRAAKVGRRALESKSVAVDFKQQIRPLVESIGTGKPTGVTAAKMASLQNFIQREVAAGREIELPRRVLKQIRRFQAVPAEDMTLADAEALSDDILMLVRLGRTKVRAFRAIFDAEKQSLKSELVAGTVPIEQALLVAPQPGESLTNLQKLNNILPAMRQAAQEIDLSLTTMDTFMDLLDGQAGFSGPNMKMKARHDMNFSTFLNRSELSSARVRELATDMDERNGVKIGIHMIRRQVGGPERLLASGVSQEKINSTKLTPKERAVADAMDAAIERTRPQVTEQLRKLYNRELVPVDQYFPFHPTFERQNVWDDIEVRIRLGDDLDTSARRTKRTEQGFTVSRTGAAPEIDINAFRVFERHMEDVHYFLDMQRDIQMHFEIANSPEYRQASGEVGQAVLLNWLDTMARKGGASGRKQIAVIRILRRNLGNAALGFRLSSMMIQPTALFDAAVRLGPGVFRSFEQVVTSKPIRVWLRDNFPELRKRGADDPAYLEVSDIKGLARVQRLGFKGLIAMDAITAAAATWEAANQAAAKLGQTIDLASPPSREVVTAAQQELRLTQTSSFFKDMPQAFTRGAFSAGLSDVLRIPRAAVRGEPLQTALQPSPPTSPDIDRSLLIFNSFIINRWNRIRWDVWRAGFVRGVNERDPKALARATGQTTWLILATIAETGIRASTRLFQAAAIGLAAGGIRGLLAALDEQFDDEKERIGPRFAREVFGNVPFVSTLLGGALYDRQLLPILQSPQDALEGVGRIVTGKKPITKVRGAIQAATGAAGAFGVPGVGFVSTLVGQFARLMRDTDLGRKPRETSEPVAGFVPSQAVGVAPTQSVQSVGHGFRVLQETAPKK